ncbi:MAG: DEAD/DEAH box helicase family protein [Candidatus Gracilibacteria bacterium]
MVARVAFYDVGMIGEAFSYAVPDDLVSTLQVGFQVYAPVGNKDKLGIVLQLMDEEEIHALKHISSIHAHSEAPLLTSRQGMLVLWIAWYYRSPLHRVLRLFIPEKIWIDNYTPNIQWKYSTLVSSDEISARSKKLKKLVEVIEAGENPKDFSKEFPERFLKEAIEKEIIKRTYLRLDPVREAKDQAAAVKKHLTSEQQEIVDTVYKETKRNIFLLFGITGSGKTHIYLELALKMQREDKQTLLLVPEIALTPQLIHYFTEAFGEKISIFHSHLSMGEKQQEWLRVKRKESTLIIGSRSGIFAPLIDLGVIIVDEEHEWTYKNEQNPRYHARRIAEAYIQLQEGTLLILGSATPSIETMYRAMEKEIVLLSLDKKIFDQTHILPA